jgi:UDP-3-O-[3-hydroxymyristoyl] glucosamine N-acyltransferase
MEKTAAEIASFLNGRVSGNGGVVIANVCGIDEADEGDLTFVANPKYLKKLKTTKASAILVSADIAAPGKNLIIVEDPYTALGKVLGLFYPEEKDFPGIHRQAFVEEGAVISEKAAIHPGAFIGRDAKIADGVIIYPGVFIGRDVSIGEDAVIYPNVSIYRKCIIGKRVILHAGVVVGSDGFGFTRPAVENFKIPQVGIVQIDDDVEIGANCTIDRATMGKTWIQRNVKIDNLVQIAHNVVIGENSVIAAQSGISGSAKLGRSVILGGQVGLVGHIQIGDNVMAAAQSGIHKDVPANQIVSGSPHMPHRKWLAAEACLPKLPEMRNTIATLTRRLEELEEKLLGKIQR